jgi:DNA-binding response OmpR family regulator
MTTSGLLVDDSKSQLLASKKVLNFWGIEADLATTVGEAESRADSQQYSFALLDYAMPGLPGGPRGLIKKLRIKSPACKIFIVTAYPDEAWDTLADLNVPVLEKPLHWEEFKETLDPFSNRLKGQASEG